MPTPFQAWSGLVTMDLAQLLMFSLIFGVPVNPVIVFFFVAAIAAVALTISHLVALRTRADLAAQDIRFSQMRLMTVKGEIDSENDPYGELAVAQKRLDLARSNHQRTLAALAKTKSMVPGFLFDRFAKPSESTQQVDTAALAIIDLRDSVQSEHSVGVTR